LLVSPNAPHRVLLHRALLSGRALNRPASPTSKLTPPEGTAATLSRGDSTAMLQSHIVEVDGRFVGAAIRLDSGYRFVAVDVRLEELDGTTWPSLGDVQRLARRLYSTGQFSKPRES
jgi:hypothetical protein